MIRPAAITTRINHDIHAACRRTVARAERFNGVINVDIRDSEPDWAPFEPPKAPDGAPSVVYIVLGDVGFSAMACGFLGAETNQWYPELTYDNHPVDQPKSPDEGYHLTEDITDKAIEFIKDAKAVAPDKPFFLYYAPGACHAPHHAPREWIDRFRAGSTWATRRSASRSITSGGCWITWRKPGSGRTRS